MPGGSQPPFRQPRKRVDAEIEIRLVAQFAQRRLQPHARDGGPRKIEREIERLLIEPIAQAGLQDFQDAGLKQRFRIGVGSFGFGGGFIRF